MNTISVEEAKAKIALLGSYARSMGWDDEYSESCNLALLCLDACKQRLEGYNDQLIKLLYNTDSKQRSLYSNEDSAVQERRIAHVIHDTDGNIKCSNCGSF